MDESVIEEMAKREREMETDRRVERLGKKETQGIRCEIDR